LQKLLKMKTKKILLAVLTIFTLASCKNEAETKEAEAQTTELKETFDVSFNLVVAKDDTFTLYYTEDNSLNFGDDRSVRSVVKGSDKPQDVLFKLPADVLPTQIRFDFGDNKEQGGIVMNSLSAKYNGSIFNADFKSSADGVKHFFYLLDEQIGYDAATSTIMPLKPANKGYDPLMWSNQLLSEELVKLYKK
jgi:hypothetical protein